MPNSLLSHSKTAIRITQVTRGWLVGLQVSPRIRDLGKITQDRTADRGVRRCRCTLSRRAPRGCVRARVDPARTRRTSEGGQVRGSIQPGRLTRSRRARLLAAGLLLGVVSVAGCTGSSGATGRGGAAPAGAVSGCLLPPASCYAPHVFRVAYGIQPLLDRGIDGRGKTVTILVAAPSRTPRQARTTPVSARTWRHSTACSGCPPRVSRS